jgi:hypothetical protein
MPLRRAFLGGAAAVVAAGGSSSALAYVVAPPSDASHSPHDEARATLDAVAVVAAAHLGVRTVWRPPWLFPSDEPIAYYVGRGGDTRYPNELVIWLNPDHPELVSPRASRLTDEIPLFTELLLASVDVRSNGVPSLGLERLDADKRRAAAAVLASNVAVIARYTPYAAVDDAEFARRSFAFAVLRQLTPGIGGVAPLVVVARAMPAGEAEAAYGGRDADGRAPHGWGVIYITSPALVESTSGHEAWVRAFVLATADRQPADSAVKRAYDDARTHDESAGLGRWEARRAFAAPYVKQVAALIEGGG